MALALTNLAVNRDPQAVFSPSDHATYADQSGNISAVTTSVPFVQIRVYIYVKTYTLGTGTVGPIFEVTDSNSNILAEFQLQRTATKQCLILLGQVPVSASTTYALSVALSGTDTISYDAMVDVR